LSAEAEHLAQRERHLDATLAPIRDAQHLEGILGHGAFALGARTVFATFGVEGGLRLDLQHVVADDRRTAEREPPATAFVVSPRARLEWRPADAWTLLLAYGHGQRPPEARAMIRADASRSDIDHSRFSGGAARSAIAKVVDAGVEVRPRPEIGAGVVAFAVDVERESIFDHVAGTTLDLNATRRMGAEAFTELRPWPAVVGRVEVTVVKARFRDSGAPVPGAPRLLVTSDVRFEHPVGLHGGARLTALGTRPLAHGARAGAYAVVDLVAGFSFALFEVTLGVDNSLGTSWNEGEYHFASHWDRTAPRSALPVLHAVAGPPIGVRGSVGVRF
jgi:outer membrane receptor protein involved in Fe transport